jgi:hypothetical protein
MAGTVFFWEGVMKFVFANQGVGRFTKLGFPAPHFTATADGWFEIIGGHFTHRWFIDARHCDSFYHRNAGSDGFDKNSDVPRDVTAAPAASASASRLLGRFA